MAELYNHIFMLGPNGLLGDQFVSERIHLENTLIANKLIFDVSLQRTETRKADEEAIRKATTYANFAQTQEVYVKTAKATGTTPYNIAVADWFGAPKVLEIDVDGWTGKIGQTIRVKARDNVMVSQVILMIRDENENLLEMGEAVRSQTSSAWWNYTTKSLVKLTPFPIVEVTAYDLPGNSDSFAIS